MVQGQKPTHKPSISSCKKWFLYLVIYQKEKKPTTFPAFQ